MVHQKTSPATVTRESQEAMGLVTKRSSGPTGKNLVLANPPQRVLAPRTEHAVTHTIDVPLSATQHVETRTSHVDRAKGYLISSVPLFASYGVGAVLIAWVGFAVPIMSIPALVIFWLTFAAIWGVSYLVNIGISAEGVAFFEAWRKWRVIEREQAERWRHYGDGGK